MTPQPLWRSLLADLFRIAADAIEQRPNEQSRSPEPIERLPQARKPHPWFQRMTLRPRHRFDPGYDNAKGRTDRLYPHGKRPAPIGDSPPEQIEKRSPTSPINHRHPWFQRMTLRPRHRFDPGYDNAKGQTDRLYPHGKRPAPIGGNEEAP